MNDDQFICIFLLLRQSQFESFYNNNERVNSIFSIFFL